MMWNTRKYERDSGPVLRDPLANRERSRDQVQPYPPDFKRRHQNNIGNGNFNYQSGFRNANMESNVAGGESLPFPPVHEEAFFPPTRPVPTPFMQEFPPAPQISLQSLVLGIQSGVTPQINPRGHESAVPIFPRSFATQPFNNEISNSSFICQPPPEVPLHLLPQALMPTPPALMPTPTSFQNQSHTQLSSASSHGFNDDNNLQHSFGQRQQPQTLNLQPQWSIQNGQFPDDQGHHPSFQGNSQQGFEQRPFNPNFQNQRNNVMASATGNSSSSEFKNSGAGYRYDRRPNYAGQSKQQQNSNPKFGSQPQRSLPSLFDTEISSDSKFGQSQSSSVSSFPSSRNLNSQDGRTFFESHNQRPIPSVANRNATARFKNNNPAENKKGQKFNQQSQIKRPITASGTNSNANGNNIDLTPTKRHGGPLLPTPKLVPYPPPPLHPNVPATPRGILKNSCSSNYSNFVKSSVPSCSENSSSVVPYSVGEGDDDDDDDEDDVEFAGDVSNSENSSSNMTHDFFSEKMVQHFSTILNGKPLDEQLDNLLKYLVLPSDFLATRVSIVRNLHVMLRDTFQNCALQPYGADFVGVGNSDDSVNVFVDLTGNQGPSSRTETTAIEPSEVTKENLDDLLNLIQEDKNHKFFGQIVRRTNFSLNRITIPVISFIHSETKVRCNIRLDNYLLVQEAKVIQFICSLDERIPSLLALARYWSSVHKVLDTPEEDTKNRFITLLLLFFLARKKIIPTMAHLQSLSVKREYFNNLDISFCDDYSLVPINDNPVLEDKTVFTLSTLSLLKEFFKLFAEAKLHQEVVSLWKAEFIPKENFSQELHSKVLPPDLRKRYLYGANGKLRGKEKRIDCGSKLCIQDFQDLTQNLTLSVAEYDVSKFQVECGCAVHKLESIMSSGTGNLMDLFIVSEYASFGTPEHREMHKKAYLLFDIADGVGHGNGDSAPPSDPAVDLLVQ